MAARRAVITITAIACLTIFFLLLPALAGCGKAGDEAGPESREVAGNEGPAEADTTAQQGAPQCAQATGGNGEAVVTFPAYPTTSPWEEELRREWVPDIVCDLIWGYRVYVNGNFFGDWPAVYTPTGTTSYTLQSPQSITLQGLTPGQYYTVDIYPLGIYFSPNLVTPDGKRYAYRKNGAADWSWAWVDRSGNPVSAWSPLQPLPETAQINNPGYFFKYGLLWSGRVQAQRSGGGGGGGKGLPM
ncbi:hypothetical protein [Candidatus Solincola tengchongensis]|uniref:hypothetical protein n=1 Tax=Candidatus Solincola tengchongensis TaxID=2900693 RepID=UPI0025805A0C|nr:hypothetical protein [Candidatus Solincola tengchongensis]